jgi:hypothetical protein
MNDETLLNGEAPNVPPSDWYRRTWVRFCVPKGTTVNDVAVQFNALGVQCKESDFNLKQTFHSKKNGRVTSYNHNSSVLFAVPREVVADLVNEKLAKFTYPQCEIYTTRCEASALDRIGLSKYARDSAAGSTETSWPPEGVKRAPNTAGAVGETD